MTKCRAITFKLPSDASKPHIGGVRRHRHTFAFTQVAWTTASVYAVSEACIHPEVHLFASERTLSGMVKGTVLMVIFSQDRDLRII